MVLEVDHIHVLSVSPTQVYVGTFGICRMNLAIFVWPLCADESASATFFELQWFQRIGKFQVTTRPSQILLNISQPADKFVVEYWHCSYWIKITPQKMVIKQITTYPAQGDHRVLYSKRSSTGSTPSRMSRTRWVPLLELLATSDKAAKNTPYECTSWSNERL